MFVSAEALAAAARNKKKKKKRRDSRQYRMARKFLFMRCICIWFGKVAGAWIWLQTIIKCRDNEWGYLSKPLHVYWAFKGPSRRKLRIVSTKTEFKCRMLKVNSSTILFLNLGSELQVAFSWATLFWTEISLKWHVIYPNKISYSEDSYPWQFDISFFFFCG